MEMGESGVGVSKKVMDWVYWEVPMRWSIKVLENRELVSDGLERGEGVSS